MSARKRRWWRTYLPNSSRNLALVSLRDRRPFRAYWPLHLTQLVGGKTWSISLVRYTTDGPQLVEQEHAEGGGVS